MKSFKRIKNIFLRIVRYWRYGGGSVSPFAWIDGEKRKIYIPKGAYVYRRAWLRAGTGGIRLGVGSNIRPYAKLDAQRGFIEIGENCSVHSFCVIYGYGGVRIGNGVRIAPQVVIVAQNHNFDDLSRPIYEQGFNSKGIVIADDVWIGAGAKILDGVTIGTGAIVGAGSVVTRDVPPMAIVAGVPARVLRMRDNSHPKKHVVAKRDPYLS
ncbi:MAG: acyltransferase [bacterium]|nr:acyltransferase [bacterium]